MVLAGAGLASGEEPVYAHGPDSVRQDGVPKGVVTRHEWKSSVFAGTVREYFVYVPAHYDGSKPAAVMVFQDGHNGRHGGAIFPETLRWLERDWKNAK